MATTEQTLEASPYLHLFRRYLRQQGLPVTQQREVVADVVFGSEEHLSVEEIETALKARGERIGKATIYRTMEILVRSGLVADHDFGDGFRRYEHLFGHQRGHQHLVCTNCRRVVEFRRPEIQRIQDDVARQHGFLPDRHRLEVYGLCPDCRAAGVELRREGLACPAITL
jgi:Fur family transcriptional regulator, ferric uptake regulator